MKMEMVFAGRVLMKGSKHGVKDPTKTYYNVSLGVNGECESFNCPQEVYDRVEEGKEYYFTVGYNTQYPGSGVRVTGLVESGKK